MNLLQPSDAPPDAPPPDADRPYEPLKVTQLDDGTLRIDTAPLPERIGISAELWAAAEPYDPEVDGDTGLEPPPLWLETVPHAGSVNTDPASPGFGERAEGSADTVLHIDAVNVACAYLLLSGQDAQQDDGVRVLELRSWSER